MFGAVTWDHRNVVPSTGFPQLEAAGRSAGLDVVGACRAHVFESTRETLEERKAAGLAGTMQFTYRNPSRSSDPHHTMPGATYLIVGACSYHRDPPEPPTRHEPIGRVARYVWADDRDRLLAGLDAVRDLLLDAGHRAMTLSDQNHLVDRAVARRAGIGWFGKNANILLPGRGSWYLLGAVLTDAPRITDLPSTEPVADGCGTCRRCIDACPTEAIVGPGVVDARRCLSWILQTTGMIPVEFRIALGDRMYGCDDCQEVCPPNRLELRRAAPGGSGEAVPVGDPNRAWVPLLELLDLDGDDILSRHGRWYIPRRDPDYIRRNALVVLGNIGDPSDERIVAVLARSLGDPNPVIRAHAVWSARRLGCDHLLHTVADDPDDLVRVEVDRPSVPRAVAARRSS